MREKVKEIRSSQVNIADAFWSRMQEKVIDVVIPFQEKVDAVAAKYGAVGLQVAVIESGQVTDAYAYGWATKGSDRMTPNHKTRIASITKVGVGLAAMALYEDGVADLDQSIGAYWGVSAKNPYYPDDPVTIRTLLTHTSSLAALGDDASQSREAVQSRLQSGGYAQIRPGATSSWRYNNYAFGVLGMTLELAADRYLDDILDEKLFSAMEIDAAFTGSGIGGTDRIAALYYHGGAVGRSVPSLLSDVRPDCPGGTGEYFAGGLIISAQDLAKLAALLANDGCFEGARLLDAESVALMESRYGRLGGGTYQALAKPVGEPEAWEAFAGLLERKRVPDVAGWQLLQGAETPRSQARARLSISDRTGATRDYDSFTRRDVELAGEGLASGKYTVVALFAGPRYLYLKAGDKLDGRVTVNASRPDPDKLRVFETKCPDRQAREWLLQMSEGTFDPDFTQWKDITKKLEKEIRK